MQIHLLRPKIHRALVTDANVEYEGSLTIDPDLIDKAHLLPYERVVCGNLANSNRFETYAIPGKRGSRCLLYTSPSPRDPKTSRMPSSA